MAAKLTIGTVVELLGGSPSLTVVKDRNLEQGNKFVGVAWFAGVEYKTEVLPKDALRVTAEAPVPAGKETPAE